MLPPGTVSLNRFAIHSATERHQSVSKLFEIVIQRVVSVGSGVALRGIDDAAHPSASGLLTESGELSMPTLSEGQWYWLQLHKNAAVEKWRARQHPERCDSAKVLVIELSAMTHGLGSQVHNIVVIIATASTTVALSTYGCVFRRSYIIVYAQIHLLSLAASYAEEDSRTLLVLPEDEWCVVLRCSCLRTPENPTQMSNTQ